MNATLENYLKSIDFRITEGSVYCWNSFGSSAYRLESWNNDHDDSRSFDIIFDTETQEVFEMTAHHVSANRSYRWINPDYIDAYREEAAQRNVDPDQAYDDVRYIDLEEVEDYYTKARAIFLHRDYDTRVSIPLNLDKEDMFKLMSIAHEKDVTLNQLVEELLMSAVDTAKENSNV